MIRSRLFFFISCTLACRVALAAPAQQPPSRSNPAPAIPQRALLDKYCATCHNDKLKTGGLTLQTADVANPSTSAGTWEKVIRKLRVGAMPPQGMPRPDKPVVDGFATYLETSIDRAALAQPNPGRATLHRLNRTEYANAVRDL